MVVLYYIRIKVNVKQVMQFSPRFLETFLWNVKALKFTSMLNAKPALLPSFFVTAVATPAHCFSYCIAVPLVVAILKAIQANNAA